MCMWPRECHVDVVRLRSKWRQTKGLKKLEPMLGPYAVNIKQMVEPNLGGIQAKDYLARASDLATWLANADQFACQRAVYQEVAFNLVAI